VWGQAILQIDFPIYRGLTSVNCYVKGKINSRPAPACRQTGLSAANPVRAASIIIPYAVL